MRLRSSERGLLVNGVAAYVFSTLTGKTRTLGSSNIFISSIIDSSLNEHITTEGDLFPDITSTKSDQYMQKTSQMLRSFREPEHDRASTMEKGWYESI